MKHKTLTIIAIALASIAALALPLGHPGGMHRRPSPGVHHAPPPAPHHHHHHGHSGAFWTGVGIGALGGIFAPPPPPPVVVHPVMVAPPYGPRVWVPPVYGERPIYRAGIYVGVERYVVTPGYWR